MNVTSINQQNNNPNFGMYKINTKGFTPIEKVVANADDTKKCLSEISKGVYQVIKKVIVVDKDSTTKFYPNNLLGRLLGSITFKFKPCVHEGFFGRKLAVDTYKNKPSIIKSLFTKPAYRALSNGVTYSPSLRESVGGLQNELILTAGESRAKSLSN